MKVKIVGCLFTWHWFKVNPPVANIIKLFLPSGWCSQQMAKNGKHYELSLMFVCSFKAYPSYVPRIKVKQATGASVIKLFPAVICESL
jgi:hypothetical protein